MAKKKVKTGSFLEELERKIALYKKGELTFGDLPCGLSSEKFLEIAEELFGEESKPLLKNSIPDIVEKFLKSKKNSTAKVPEIEALLKEKDVLVFGEDPFDQICVLIKKGYVSFDQPGNTLTLIPEEERVENSLNKIKDVLVFLKEVDGFAATAVLSEKFGQWALSFLIEKGVLISNPVSGVTCLSPNHSEGVVEIQLVIKTDAGPYTVFMKVGKNLWEKIRTRAEKDGTSIDELLQKMIKKL